MPRFRMEDLRTIENAPTSPGTLKGKIGQVILNSTSARAKVELINPDTGEYRVVLQGTLDNEATHYGE